MSKLRVLIVDDHQDVLESVSDLLNSWDMQVYSFMSANNALREISVIKPDLIVSDIMMPEMDGLDFVSRVRSREIFKEIPIIFLTAKIDVDSRVEGFNAGGNYYISKPFQARELKAILKNAEIYRTKNLQDKYAENLLSKDERFLTKLDTIIHKNLSNGDLRYEQIANELGVSSSALQKKIKRIKNKAITQYIREYRLEQARVLVEKDVATISEIAYQTGFNSHSYFSKSFQDYFEISPKQLSIKIKRGIVSQSS